MVKLVISDPVCINYQQSKLGDLLEERLNSHGFPLAPPKLSFYEDDDENFVHINRETFRHNSKGNQFFYEVSYPLFYTTMFDMGNNINVATLIKELEQISKYGESKIKFLECFGITDKVNNKLLAYNVKELGLDVKLEALQLTPEDPEVGISLAENLHKREGQYFPYLELSECLINPTIDFFLKGEYHIND